VLESDRDAQIARCHIVTSLWLQHLVACANGMPMTSVQLGLDGQVVFKPLAQIDAMAILQRLVAVYLAAWQRPLPLACKTAWAYLQTQAKTERLAQTDPGKEPQDPHEVARVAFEGSHWAGERDESAYLARAFESYDEIESELPHWAQALYGDMARHVQLMDEEEVAP
jgi:exodeoxyribonuclease V gamma subunit